MPATFTLAFEEHELIEGPIASRIAAAIGTQWPLRRSRVTMPPQTRWAKLPEMVGHGDDALALYQLAYALCEESQFRRSSAS